MKVNKITVYYSATVQMRQFEPIVISASVEAQVDPGETVAQVFNKVYNAAQKEIDDQIKVKKVERKNNFDSELEKNV